jgi:hypothetical protein
MFLYPEFSEEPPQPLLLGGAKPKAVLVLSPLSGEMPDRAEGFYTRSEPAVPPA